MTAIGFHDDLIARHRDHRAGGNRFAVDERDRVQIGLCLMNREMSSPAVTIPPYVSMRRMTVSAPIGAGVGEAFDQLVAVVVVDLALQDHDGGFVWVWVGAHAGWV